MAMISFFPCKAGGDVRGGLSNGKAAVLRRPTALEVFGDLVWGPVNGAGGCGSGATSIESVSQSRKRMR